MIGHLIGAYCMGRRDAAAGRKKRTRGHDDGHGDLAAYRQGYKDERRRMEHEKRLAQLELELDASPDHARAPSA